MLSETRNLSTCLLGNILICRLELMLSVYCSLFLYNTIVSIMLYLFLETLVSGRDREDKVWVLVGDKE